MSVIKYKEVLCPFNKHLNIKTKISSKILREIADKMDEDDIKWFKFDGYTYNYKCFECRKETEAEHEKRLKKEEAQKVAKAKKLEKENNDLMVKAKSLGLTLVESNIYE